MKKAAIYSIFLGSIIIIQWIFFAATGNIPELQSAPLEIGFHIANEMITAILLIVSGIVLVKNVPWAKYLYIFSTGMVIYAMINASGYFIQRGVWAIVGMFLVFVVLSLYFGYRLFKS